MGAGRVRFTRDRIHTAGHFQSSDRPENRHADDRFQSTAAIGRLPLEARSDPFSKAVALGLAALVGIRCRPYIRSSIGRTGTADPMEMLGASGCSVGNAAVNGPSACTKRGQDSATMHRSQLCVVRTVRSLPSPVWCGFWLGRSVLIST